MEQRETGPVGARHDKVMCATILFVSLYLEQEVRTDEEEDRQLATSTGAMARPGFVARVGDRRS